MHIKQVSARTFAFATFRLPFAVCRRRKYVHLINTRQSAHFISLRFAFSFFVRGERAGRRGKGMLREAFTIKATA